VWDENPTADDYALRHDMISVSPLHYNLTDEELYGEMEHWDIAKLLRKKKGRA